MHWRKVFELVLLFCCCCCCCCCIGVVLVSHSLCLLDWFRLISFIVTQVVSMSVFWIDSFCLIIVVNCKKGRRNVHATVTARVIGYCNFATVPLVGVQRSVPQTSCFSQHGWLNVIRVRSSRGCRHGWYVHGRCRKEWRSDTNNGQNSNPKLWNASERYIER